MAVLRNRTQKNFTIVSNGILQEKSLTLKERGMLATLLSLPDDWDFTVFGLMKIIPEKKDAINSAINSLEKKGYIKRYRLRDELGHMKATVIEVFDVPQTDVTDESDDNSNIYKVNADNPESNNPDSDYPDADNPTLGNPTLDNPTLENPALDEPTLEMPKLDEPMLEKQPQYNTKDNIILSKSVTKDNKDINKYINNSINPEDSEKISYWDEMTVEVISGYIDRLKENIGYDNCRRTENNHDFELFDDLINVIIRFISNPPEGYYVHVANKDRPYDEVRDSFMKLKYEHIDAVRQKLKNVDLSRVVSFDAYVLTVLFNISSVNAGFLRNDKKTDKTRKIQEYDYDFDELEKILCN